MKFGEGGELFPVCIGEDDSPVGEHLDGAVEGGLWSFGALGDGADLAGGFCEEGYDLRGLGEIYGAYADGVVFG